MIASIVKTGRQRLTGNSIIYSLMFATLLLISSPQAISMQLLQSTFLIDRHEQGDIIDLSNRPDAKAFSDINNLLAIKDYATAIEKANTVLKNNPNSGLANEVLGTAYFLNKQQEKAATSLQKAIELEPGQSGALTKLGIIKMESGDIFEAEKLLLKAIEITPADRFAHQRLGLLYEYQAKDQRAIHHFQLGLEGTHESYLGVAVNLGRLLNKSGNFAVTIAVLEPRVLLYETNTDAQMVLATAYLATGNYLDARMRFQHVLQSGLSMPKALLGLAKAQRGESDFSAAMKTINKLVKQKPDSALAQMEKGEILLRLDQRKKANSAFNEAVALGLSRSYVNQRIAKFHLDNKDFAQARDIYQAMVDDKTADVFTYGQLSELLMGEGNIEKGELILRNGIERFPNDAYLHLRLGSYLASIRSYEESLPILEKATELSADDIAIWKVYALALARTDHNEDAVNAAARLYVLQPNRTEPAIFYATQLEANKRFDEAETLYRKIIQAVPNHALALNNLANILADKGDHNEAETMARRAVGVVSDNASILDTLGWVLYKQGNLNESLEVLDNANKLAPEAAVIWYHKGVVLDKTGRRAEAKVAIEKALSINSKANWADAAGVLLTQL
ncbi:Tetratricopeptide TPR_2 repeat protein [Psychromonas ingrahamii 37]|uniref:Tetratricopeptide TPR_2 repeat protein n=1 Tax=Psychromonas ingrahamii (strain DSM 17664 / CCUG 51855 / 37) TaxID=357804 RepID=A1SUZ8_PSYIN|nr:tetratricopeptide repeat protein [Psychromonas ingrahamii]ABM03313.1 Tetratricopeptide TPR_2 repeat protein [Psychromonas ingrahamii 37]